MSFEQHIFISYAHIDNQPLTAEQEGWITRFHASLDALLSMRLGRKASIWRDDKLRGNDVFADEITDQFESTALLISVLTPRYVNSEWCTREIREFCQKAEASGGVVIDNKSRVLKVLKTPVDSPQSLPDIVEDMLGYEFFTMEDGAPLELDPAYGVEFAHDYNRKMGKLAWDAAQLLKMFEEAPAEDGSGSEKGEEKATVYLSECSHDRRDAREMLEADLKLHGYAVLPDQRMPLVEEAGYVDAARRALERCSLSIHLVGSTYGAVPDGPSQKSTTILQNELAVELAKGGALQRLIWLPEETSSDQPQQREFLTALHGDAGAQFGADLITGDLEELKSAIHATLKAQEEAKAAASSEPAPESDTKQLVYLICVEQDRKPSVPLRKFLKNAGLEVALPAFEGDAAAVREANQKLMRSCDAVIVFYGGGDEPWKRTIDNELKKLPGYRSGEPLLASFTYLAEPATGDKEDMIDMEEPNLIVGVTGFDEGAMADFMQAMNSGGAAC